MKYYIATKLENHTEHNRLMQALAEMGHECTYDWTVHGPVWEHGLHRIKTVATLEALGVKQADEVIVIWPGGRGTHVELGIALGCGLPVNFISDVESHHTASPDTCAFYHHPLVRRYRSVEEFLKSPSLTTI